MQLELDHDDLDLLAWNISNEVINGFKVDKFRERIGESEEEFKNTSIRLRSIPEGQHIKLSPHEAMVFRNALTLTLDELGVDEFSTRTGYDFDKGKKVLRKLEDFLDENPPSPLE